MLRRRVRRKLLIVCGVLLVFFVMAISNAGAWGGLKGWCWPWWAC